MKLESYQICVCDNCQSEHDIDDLKPLAAVPDLGQRLTPGSIVPAGECPECQSLSYIERKKVTIPPSSTLCPNCDGSVFEQVTTDIVYGEIDPSDRVPMLTNSDVVDTGPMVCRYCNHEVTNEFEEIYY